MPSGCIHCPFLMLTGAPVSPAARSRSVCRQRNAGICNTSTTAAAGAHWSASWTSVSSRRPVAARTRSSAAKPSSRQGPRAAAALDRFALSKLALKITPPGSRSLTRARCSATRRFRASSSSTQGPAMRNRASQGNAGRVAFISIDSIGGFIQPERARLAAFPIGDRGADEPLEQRVRTRGPGPQLGVELTPHEPRMVGQLDHLHQRSIGREARQPHALPHELVTILIRPLVAVALPFLYLAHVVGLGGTRAARQSTDVAPEPHGATHVGDVLLLFHERDDGVRAFGCELARVAVGEREHVAGELHDGDLHTEADAEERQPHLARRPDGLDHSVDAAHTKPAGHEEPVVTGQQTSGGRRVGEPVAADPGNVDADIVIDAAVDERLLDALVAVDELGVLANDGDADA